MNEMNDYIKPLLKKAPDNVILYVGTKDAPRRTSIETHLALVRGLPTKKFLPECVNKKSSTERRS